jgi:hypothetical protein
MGMMVSMGIVMLIFTLHPGGAAIEPCNYPVFVESPRTVFVVFASMCFGGIFASLARGKALKMSSASREDAARTMAEPP